MRVPLKSFLVFWDTRLIYIIKEYYFLLYTIDKYYFSVIYEKINIISCYIEEKIIIIAEGILEGECGIWKNEKQF